jgi:hypothetical protein
VGERRGGTDCFFFTAFGGFDAESDGGGGDFAFGDFGVEFEFQTLLC